MPALKTGRPRRPTLLRSCGQLAPAAAVALALLLGAPQMPLALAATVGELSSDIEAPAVADRATEAVAAPAIERQASLRAALTLAGLDGQPLTRVTAGEPFRLDVTLTDAALAQAPRGLALSGWLRRKLAGQPSCQDAARAYRATHRLPRDAVDLNGILIVQLNDDASLGVVDPTLDLRSSNMVAATRFDEAPDALVLDPRRQLALASFSRRGEVRAVSLLDGRQTSLARALAAPRQLLLSGSGETWVEEQSPPALVQLGTDGAVLQRVPLGTGDFTILAGEQGLVAWSAQGRLIVLDRRPGAGSPTTIETGNEIRAATLASGGALLTLDATGRTATLRFLDAPGGAVTLSLRAAADVLTSALDAKQVFAWSREHGAVSVIDVASARQITGFETDRPFSEVAMGPGQTWFLQDDYAMAYTVDLASLGLGKPPALRATPLQAATTESVVNDRTTGQAGVAPRRLVPLLPSPQALAVNADAGTAFVLEPMTAFGKAPPMNSVRLRGGVVQAIDVLDRSFRESAPGRYTTHARLNRPGEHELVLTTGIGGMTACLPVWVDGAEAVAERLDLTVRVTKVDQVASSWQAGGPQRLRLELVDRNGQPWRVDRIALAIPSLASSWAGRGIAQRNADGALVAEVTFPHPGSYAIQPLAPASGRISIAPTTIVVR